MSLLVWFALLGVAGVFAYLRNHRRDTRAHALADLAQTMGLGFSAVDVFDDRWQPFRLFGMGIEQEVENVVYGSIRDVPVRAFDFRYLSGEQGSVGDLGGWRTFSCAVIGVPASCPPLVVQPRSIDDALDELLGADVLPLELEEFNRRFRVRCEDRRFAMAFLEQRMMAALLAVPLSSAIAVNEDRLLLVSRRLPVEEVAVLLHAAAAVAAAVPRVLPSLYPLRAGSTGVLHELGPHEVAEGFDRYLSRRRQGP
jgi:hypothetical protein